MIFTGDPVVFTCLGDSTNIHACLDPTIAVESDTNLVAPPAQGKVYTL